MRAIRTQSTPAGEGTGSGGIDPIDDPGGALTLGAGGVLAETAPADITVDHLAVVDIDGDGEVDLTEYRVTTSNAFILLDSDAAGTLTAEEAGAIPADLFAAMDGNGDGVVDRIEYDTQVLADFEAADLDGNGRLN